jgi:hypothetical protein
MTRTGKGKATKGSALVDYDKCTNGCGLQSLGNESGRLFASGSDSTATAWLLA